MINKENSTGKLLDLTIYAILAIAASLSILPIINTIAVSFSNSAIASAGMVTVYPLGFNLESYNSILKESAFFNAFGISVKRVAIGLVLTFFMTTITAYPLSKEVKEFKARNFYMWILIFSMMFGPALVPLYLTIKGLNLRGTIWALVLPGLVAHFLIILVVNYFRSLPKELGESASIDGAGPWYILFKIYIPLSTPVLATISLFSVVGHWNSFFDGLLYMNRTDQYPLQTYIQQLVATFNPNIIDPDRITELLKISERTLNAAKIIISMIPILVLYPFLQRYFVSGIMLGSVKG